MDRGSLGTRNPTSRRTDRQVLAGELQRLAQVGLAFARCRTCGCRSPPRPRRRSRRREVAQEPSAPIDAAAGHQVLVLGRAGAVGEVDVAQPGAEPRRPSRSRRSARSRRGTGRSWCWRRARSTGPSRAGTSPCLASARPARDTCSRPRRRCRWSPPGPRCRRRSSAAYSLLPAERRVHDDDLGADLVRHLRGALQLAPRLGAPDPLGEEQARRVHGGDRHRVVVGELLDRRGLLAQRVDADHHLDGVVAERAA